MRAGLAKVRGEAYEKRSLRSESPRLAEIRIPFFTGDDFPQWIQETFRTLREKRTRSLIIDLRSNGGGEDSYGILLVSYLTDKPFHYGTTSPSTRSRRHSRSTGTPSRWTPTICEDPRRPRTEPRRRLFRDRQTERESRRAPAGQTPFLGDVFILTDGSTFSTAADFFAWPPSPQGRRLHRRGDRRGLLQEQLGHRADGDPAQLDGFVFGLPLTASWNAVSGYDGKRRGTIPDHVALMKSADVLRGLVRRWNWR